MFTAGLESLQKNTKAKPGDKTIMDAVVPAVEAFGTDSNDLKRIVCIGSFRSIKRRREHQWDEGRIWAGKKPG